MTTIRQTDRPGHDEPAGHDDPAGRDDPSGSTAPGAGLPRAWALVARREISSKLVDRTFLVGTLFTLLMIAGLVLAQALLSERVDDYDVAATPAATSMAQDVADQATGLDDKVRVRVVDVPDDAAARAALTDEEADAWLTPGADGWVLVGRDEVPRNLEEVTATVVRDTTLTENAEAAGTTVAAMTRGSQLTTDVLVGDADQRDFAQGMAFALAFLFYLSSIAFGMTLAGSVVEEKQSRIVEIIATKIPVRQLLAGKVIGNTGLAVAQMALYAAIGLVGLSFTSFGSFLPSVTGALGWFLVFFLFGFLLLACLWAVAGALASRTEDLQSTSTPITLAAAGHLLRVGLPQRHAADGALVRPAGLGGADAAADPRGQRPVVGAGRLPRHPARRRLPRWSSWPSGCTAARCCRPRAGSRCVRRGRHPSEAADAGPELDVARGACE